MSAICSQIYLIIYKLLLRNDSKIITAGPTRTIMLSDNN